MQLRGEFHAKLADGLQYRDQNIEKEKELGGIYAVKGMEDNKDPKIREIFKDRDLRDQIGQDINRTF